MYDEFIHDILELCVLIGFMVLLPLLCVIGVVAFPLLTLKELATWMNDHGI